MHGNFDNELKFKTYYRIMQVKSTIDLHLSLKSLLCLFLSGSFTVFEGCISYVDLEISLHMLNMDSSEDSTCFTYVSCIRIYHECEIEKSVPRITVSHHKACRMMTIVDHDGRIFLSHPHTNNGFFFLITTK